MVVVDILSEEKQDIWSEIDLDSITIESNISFSWVKNILTRLKAQEDALREINHKQFQEIGRLEKVNRELETAEAQINLLKIDVEHLDKENKILGEKADIFDAWEEGRCGYFKPGYGCTSPTGIGNSVMCRKLPNCEVLTDEILWKQIKTARNKLYEDLPTGDVDAFALIKVVKTHIAKLDEILEDT